MEKFKKEEFQERKKEQKKLTMEHVFIIMAVGLAPLLGNLDGTIVMIASPHLATIFKEIRGRAFGFTGLLGSVGFAIGAPVGGFILKYLSWHWLFLFNVPIGIAGAILSYKFLKHKKSVEQKREYDCIGALLSLICLLAFVFVLKKGQVIGWTTPLPLIFFSVSIISFFLFVLREKNCSAPLVDIATFKNFSLTFAAIAAFLIIVLLNGIIFIFPFFLEIVKKLPTDQAGFLLMIMPVALFIFSPVAGYLSDKKRPHVIASVASVFILLSCVGFFLLETSTPLRYIMLLFALFGISFAFFFVANVTLIMGHAIKGKEGVLSAVLAVINSIGALIGISLFQILFSLHLNKEIKELHTVSSVEIMHGFQTAMVFAIIICIPVLISSIIAKEKIATED